MKDSEFPKYTMVELPKLGGYAVVPADAKILILSFPITVDGQEVQLDVESVRKEVASCLKEAGMEHLQVMLCKGLEKVEVLK